MSDYVITPYKFVIALNKSLEVGVALNAAGHMALGLMSMVNNEQKEIMKFVSYDDADGNKHIASAHPLIILRGSGGDLRKLREAALQAGLLVNDFTQTMTGGGYQEQQANSKVVSEANNVYYGVAVFGLREQLDPLTKKLSLWRTVQP